MKSLHWPAVVFSVQPRHLFTLQGLLFRNTGRGRLDLLIGPKDGVIPAIESFYECKRQDLDEYVIALPQGIPWSQDVDTGTILEVDGWWVAVTNGTRSQLTAEAWIDKPQPSAKAEVPASLARRLRQEPPGRNGVLQE